MSTLFAYWANQNSLFDMPFKCTVPCSNHRSWSSNNNWTYFKPARGEQNFNRIYYSTILAIMTPFLLSVAYSWHFINQPCCCAEFTPPCIKQKIRQMYGRLLNGLWGNLLLVSKTCNDKKGQGQYYLFLESWLFSFDTNAHCFYEVDKQYQMHSFSA